jgi:ribosomal protein S27E
MKTHSTYHADCLCGKPITSETRVTKCEDCGRIIVFEWGGDMKPKKEERKP